MRKKHSICLAIVCLCLGAIPALAQNASLVGTVRDAQQAIVPGAMVTLQNTDTGVELTTISDELGNYEFPTVRPGNYSVKVELRGFQTFVQAPVVLAVGQRSRVDAVLRVGEISTIVSVEAAPATVQTETSSLGDVVDNKKIGDIPLNGRFFLDLALLTAGTVVPSTNSRTFLASPSGIGMSGINASGTREDSTNYVFDGINLSDMVQNQITFQPNIEMIQEFKVLTNAFSAEYGRNAGIIITGVSKSGSNSIHGSAFEFVRNEKFDAKNFFDPVGPIPPFKRNVYGYSVGGPIRRNKTFFFTSYEGRQGREVATIKTQVPSEAQRAGVTHPIVQKLLAIVPHANDATGTFVNGSAPRKRELNQFTGRIDHNFSAKNFIYGTFLSNRDSRSEPTLQANNLPGFGDFRPAKRELLALAYTRVMSPTMTNELRAGLNRVSISFTQDDKANPVDFGITSPSAVFPNFNVPGALRFGGIDGFPQGRGDTTFQYSDTLGWVHGRHAMKFGADFRR